MPIRLKITFTADLEYVQATDVYNSENCAAAKNVKKGDHIDLKATEREGGATIHLTGSDAQGRPFDETRPMKRGENHFP